MRADNIRRASMWAKALLLRPERRFWLIVGLIALGGGALRVLVHDYGLPWLHHSDQASLWLTVQWQRGLLPQEVAKPGTSYPPLFLWLHHLAQPLAEAQGRALAADVILDLRRLILLANVAGTASAALLGRRCGGALAGIVVAVLWAFTPIMLDVPIHAIGESLAYPLLIVSLLLAVQALEPARRWQLALASLAVAALCFLLEYRLLVAFFPGAAALLLRARAHFRPGWRRTALWAGVGITLALVTGAILLALLPARFQEVAAQTMGEYLWDLPGLMQHFRAGARAAAYAACGSDRPAGSDRLAVQPRAGKLATKGAGAAADGRDPVADAVGEQRDSPLFRQGSTSRFATQSRPSRCFSCWPAPRWRNSWLSCQDVACARWRRRGFPLTCCCC